MAMSDEQRDHLILEMNDLIIKLQGKQLDLYEELADHRKYHTENEHRWGIVKLIRKRPFWSLLVAFLLGGLVFDVITMDQIIRFIEAIK